MNQFHAAGQYPAGIEHRVSRADDVDLQAEALIYRGWNQRYDQLSAGRFAGSMQEIVLPAFTLIRETCNRVLLQKGSTPEGVFAIGSVISFTEDGYHCGDVMQARSAALLDPCTEFEIRTPETFDLVAAVFTPETLCAFVDDPQVDHEDLAQRLHGSAKTIAPEHAGALADFLLRAFESSVETPDLLFVPSSLKQFSEEFYTLLCDTFEAGQRHPRISVCPNRERIVRRFRAFLEACPEAALSIADICDEVGVTRRTLQNATQEVFGISPQHYLKAIRLNAFRRALKARRPERESIGDVAARWGFWHLSQLAQDYRKLFGELPSQTPCIHLS